MPDSESFAMSACANVENIFFGGVKYCVIERWFRFGCGKYDVEKKNILRLKKKVVSLHTGIARTIKI